jgi:putative membrane protein
MNIVTEILSVLVAIEFFYIFYLETVATSSDKTSKVFGMTKEELSQKNVNVLFKNQGVYNGLLSVLILLAVFAFASKAAVVCLMAYIVAVAAYGSVTSNPKIILMQGGLAILTLLSCIFWEETIFYRKEYSWSVNGRRVDVRRSLAGMIFFHFHFWTEKSSCVGLKISKSALTVHGDDGILFEHASIAQSAERAAVNR